MSWSGDTVPLGIEVVLNETVLKPNFDPFAWISVARYPTGTRRSWRMLCRLVVFVCRLLQDFHDKFCLYYVVFVSFVVQDYGIWKVYKTVTQN